MLERGREVVEDFLNAEGRGGGHVMLGLALLAGVGLSTAMLAKRGADAIDETGARLRSPGHGVVEKPRSLMSALAPVLLSATTLSALRVWNAPSDRARARALGLGGGLQLLNAGVIAMRPRRFAQQVAAAMLTAGLTTAYAHEARKLDRRAGTIVQPQAGGVGMSNMVRDVLRRRTRQAA